MRLIIQECICGEILTASTMVGLHTVISNHECELSFCFGCGLPRAQDVPCEVCEHDG